jgi:hypothetical protein
MVLQVLITAMVVEVVPLRGLPRTELPRPIRMEQRHLLEEVMEVTEEVVQVVMVVRGLHQAEAEVE